MLLEEDTGMGCEIVNFNVPIEYAQGEQTMRKSLPVACLRSAPIMSIALFTAYLEEIKELTSISHQ